MRALLIASIGNPGAQYAQTLHSAGHTLLSALVGHTGSPPLYRSASYAKGLISLHPSLSTLFWASPVLMNVSGPPLAATWRTFSASHAASNPHLVILHDELEIDTGKFSIKTSAGGSARGHNGLKSFLGTPGMKDLSFTRVGVGIGPRPRSREPEQVAAYVLGRMSERQRVEIEGLAGDVWGKLQVLQVKG